MKKLIPAILTLAFTISTVSLSVGCSGDAPADPNATNLDEDKKVEGTTEDKGGEDADGVNENPANADFNEDGTPKNPDPPKED